MAPSISIVDQTFRDAHQCLWATRMRTAHMLPVAERMDRIGFQRIEAIAAVQFDVCVRFLKEDPWERVRLLRQRIKTTPLSSFLRSKNIVSFDVVPDDVVALWVERLIANGVRRDRLIRWAQRRRQYVDRPRCRAQPRSPHYRCPVLQPLARAHRCAVR